MTARIQWLESDQFEPITDEMEARRTRGQGTAPGADAADPVPPFLRDPDVSQILEVVEVRSQRVRSETIARTARAPEVAVAINVDDGSDYMLIVRHPSGALTFHDGKETGTRHTRSGTKSRKSRKTSYVIEFRASVAISANDTVRRGLFDTVFNAVVDAIIVKVTGFIAETAVDLAEAAIWQVLGRKRGLFRVSSAAGAGLELKPAGRTVMPGPNGRALLFLHGTFSTTQNSFGALANSGFFDRIKHDYGEAIYALDHFTVSASPEQNALDLLSALPSGGLTFDVITFSRGGLILRNLVERKDDLKKGNRFSLGHAVLVASPNEGTPLATPGRWDDTIGWIANVLDLFPPNPVTSNIGMVAHWITWFVKVGIDAAEGLDSMNQGGAQIRELQQQPSPQPGQYSALVSNFEPDRRLWARAVDLGVDWFFNGANDLVVPTVGGWRVDRTPQNIPAERIGVFGPGGNIDRAAPQINHFGFFERPETEDFLVRALKGEPQNLPVIDPGAALPIARRSPSGGLLSAGAEPVAAVAAVPAEVQAAPRPASPIPMPGIAAQPYSSVFELIVLDPNQVELLGLPVTPDGEDNSTPLLYAAYGGARVTIPFRFKKAHVPPETGDKVADLRLASLIKELNQRWGRLFGYHRRVRQYLDGEPDAQPLTDEHLRDFGDSLFETLFPSEVRRLYDVARARENKKLFVVFTSMIPWVFDMPWEFARDSLRGTFLATEDVYFIRNVLTPTPVDKLGEGEKLRMLVAIAEPSDMVALSGAEEVAKLRKALEGLHKDGLIEFEILERAKAQTLHHAVATGNFDVVHFVGHGYWDRTNGDSGLVLEDDSGRSSLLGGRALREVLTGRGIRLIFLNACDTGRGRIEDGKKTVALAGVAQDLFASGVPNVIANQFPVGDRAAVAFARSIYDFMAHGKSFAEAVREARIAANYEKGGENVDWAIPVAYARDPKDRLVRVEAADR